MGTVSPTENTEFNGIAYEEMWEGILTGKYHAAVLERYPAIFR